MTTKPKSATLAELREHAESAGITVPEKATKSQIEELLTERNTDAPADATERKHSAACESREIGKTTPRGDWLDPFSGMLIYHGDDISPVSGARREGAVATLEG